MEKLRSETLYYNLVATKFELPFLDDSGVSGPFEILAKNKFLFVSRCGIATIAELRSDGFHIIEHKPLPNAKDVFCAGAESPAAVTTRLPNRLLFGVKGMKFDAARGRLFIDTQSIEDGHCLVVKVFEYPLTVAPFSLGAPTEIFSSPEKIPGSQGWFKSLFDCPNIESLIGTQAGGSISLDEIGNIYFSVGDFGFNIAAQDAQSPYGKILKFDGHSVSNYAIGLRNSEGLYFDPETKKLFDTDQGPKGGDELNEVEQGDNFGWPISSYGISYLHVGNADFRPARGEEQWGHHDFGKKPLFAYVPDIGVTDLTVVHTNSMFKDWGGSVLIASLRGNGIYRVLLDDGRGMYSEPIINLKSRIRYLKQDSDGTLYAKADPDLFYVIQLDWPDVRREDPQIDRGSVILDEARTCETCHLPHVSHAGIPDIYDLKLGEITSNLKRLATSETADPVMRGIAKALTPEEIRQLDSYFSTFN
ncbi:PQQ-dependent sugar dehydrogenase [uncultured Methylovirgula sp.]|uniref:PQQ-dependent sugar dehydrogenase n=1 Tax=uncultured Methylovirgula sp. TaxID=1285960 RepID=UPI002628608C|nr:PQQ-dependent sugar dehydrogenase [uncultured Methylovirgula sp.]